MAVAPGTFCPSSATVIGSSRRTRSSSVWHTKAPSTSSVPIVDCSVNQRRARSSFMPCSPPSARLALEAAQVNFLLEFRRARRGRRDRPVDDLMAVVLVIDDEADMVSLLREVLEREGHEVLTARDGR